jgi:hypothetical protein
MNVLKLVVYYYHHLVMFLLLHLLQLSSQGAHCFTIDLGFCLKLQNCKKINTTLSCKCRTVGDRVGGSLVPCTCTMYIIPMKSAKCQWHTINQGGLAVVKQQTYTHV